MIKDFFSNRHIGPETNEIAEMAKAIGVSSIEELTNQIIPGSIRLQESLNLDSALTEYEYFNHIKDVFSKNKLFRSFIGMGYYRTSLPAAILRNVFENPGWYTSYTPYQAEISQGRLEALLNFQTMISELTGMEISNCSLLDEGTAAAEAMNLMFEARSRQATKENKNILFVDQDTFPQSIEVIKLRAEAKKIEVIVGDFNNFDFPEKTFGAILQYPSAKGIINDYSAFCEKAHSKEILVCAIADTMSLNILQSPASWGADIAVGNTQRFGIPMGYGGPHAAYLATSDKYKRIMPGRIIGISLDKNGKRALRMALQTREQHIKREKATSNICTAQALLATMAGFYAVYHGPKGLKRIANNIHSSTIAIAQEIKKLGYSILNDNFFDTIHVLLPENISKDKIKDLATNKEINFNYFYKDSIGISLDEVISIDELNDIISIFAQAQATTYAPLSEIKILNGIDHKLNRSDKFLEQAVFNSYHSETELMRYIKTLENRDISLNRSMIPLGSCTMKLNSANSLLPLSWVEAGNIHPFVPKDQAIGYQELIKELAKDLSIITGFDSTTLQPNSGASGEFTGLLIIQAYHKDRNESHRDICIIPSSAHGTNPASAAMAGLKIVLVECDENGNVNIDDLRLKAEANKDNLSCIMITYPSTHGVFESRILEIIDIIHKNGGQVYMDGANMNAQVGLTSPGHIGADVCHLNLHKTFAIPHGGGGPGVGAIAVAKHLSKFLPSHPIIETGGSQGILPVAAAPYGSAFVLPITYAYIKMMGYEGLTMATKVAMLNANYIANELKNHFNILYTGETGRCAHEMILDLSKFRQEYDIEAADIARRLMDFGFHAPTLSFPVHETLMIEPTESENKKELDRFISALKTIKDECEAIKSGKLDKEDNPLKNAPHTQEECTADQWNHKYTRQQAAFPLDWIKENKFWCYVAKVDNAYGDRNLLTKTSE